MFGIHDFVIDAFHVRTPVLAPGMPRGVTFTADKKGTYEFYSSIAQDRQLGMKGTLIVQ
jgi:plastocyanin